MLLLQANANPNIRNKRGKRPFDLLTQGSTKRLVQCCQQQGILGLFWSNNNYNYIPNRNNYNYNYYLLNLTSQSSTFSSNNPNNPGNGGKSMSKLVKYERRRGRKEKRESVIARERERDRLLCFEVTEVCGPKMDLSGRNLTELDVHLLAQVSLSLSFFLSLSLSHTHTLTHTYKHIHILFAMYRCFYYKVNKN